MSITSTCTYCGRAYRLDDRYLGKRVKCSQCMNTFLVATDGPAGETQPAAGVAAAAAPQAAAGEHAMAPGSEAAGSADEERGARPVFPGEGGSPPQSAPAAAPFTALATPAAAPRAIPASPARPVQYSSYADPTEESAVARLVAGLMPWIAAILVLSGLAVEVFGWMQMLSSQLTPREVFSWNDAAGATANALRYVRLELRAGIYIVTGLLMLILAAQVGRSRRAHVPR